MEDLIIKKASASDLNDLKKISIKTFEETFSENNSTENMQAYLETSFSDKQLEHELSNPNSQFYFACLGEVIVGYLKVNTGEAQSEKDVENGFEIERIYVQADFHGKKVGQALFNKAIELAKNNSYDAVWLGVWENNHRALNFYTKNGFEVFGSHEFHLGQDKQTDLMMKKQLNHE